MKVYEVIWEGTGLAQTRTIWVAASSIANAYTAFMNNTTGKVVESIRVVGDVYVGT